ncbi:MAG: hypothetical protein V1862_09805 [Methanobacteriota archaeon]
MNSASFARAEAAWLEPPEYHPTPDDLDEDYQRVKKEVETITLSFAEEFCGEVEDSGCVEVIIDAARAMITTLEEKTAELEEIEESLSCLPDPDAEYDDPEF